MVAKGYGFNVWGIDIDRQSVEIAKSVLGNNIHFMELGQFVKFAKERNLEFDVITFFEKVSTFGIHRLGWLMVRT
jgi:2-polyprenyl-3-methyl-5-hydroxy-6-metoxy-1,4-benzoquinol methylase